MTECGCARCGTASCLTKVPIFKNLKEDEQMEIMEHIRHQTFAKGDVLIREGNTSDTLYFVNEGMIKLYKYTTDGKEQILHILTEGDFLGELSLLKITEHSFHAKALVDGKLCMLSKKELSELILKMPSIGLSMLETMGERLTESENLVQYLASNDVDARLASLLLSFAKNDKTIITMPLTREEMANYMGVTRETVSRKLHKFEENEWIHLQGHKKIEIINKKELQNLI